MLRPTRVPMEGPSCCYGSLVALATHSLHTLALTQTGHVFSFGFGSCGELGHGTTTTLWQPKLIEALAHERVVSIATGQQHSLVLTDAGASRAFGSGFSGKLGLGDQRNHALPMAIGGPLADGQTRVLAAGAAHSLAADDNGRVYTFGFNADCQLGHGTRQDEYTPRLVAALQGERIVRLAGGEHHSLAVDDAGRAYSWGAGEARERTSGFAGGWLGHRTNDPQPLPRRIDALAHIRVVAVSAGSLHSLALADGGARGLARPARAAVDARRGAHHGRRGHGVTRALRRGGAG